MPPKEGQTKKAKMAAANNASKRATKKWSKGQTREALQNAVMFDKDTLEKLRNEVPKYKLITPAIISDRLKITVSLASAALKQLCREKQIRLVSCSSKHRVYSRIVVAAPPQEASS
ncbi:unnamed protein product [Phytomonas sp. EM1]|nr:unnamed protein product [Phytomonas sp. EM1]|eukprot:CCW63386.1 unnamed protein product [Phytomonas sp. isolate EM1]